MSTSYSGGACIAVFMLQRVGGGDERYMENEGGSRKSGREKRRLYEREVGPIIGGMFVIGRQQSSRAYKTPRQR